jgi:hypothetical protein
MAKLFTKNKDTARRVEATYADTKDAAQKLLVREKKTARSNANNAKDTARKTFTSAKDTAQDRLANTKDFIRSKFKTTRNTTQDRVAQVQGKTKVWLDKALDLLVTGVSIIIVWFYQTQRRTQKKLKQARASLQKKATPIVEKTQNVVVTGTKNASNTLQKAAANAKDTVVTGTKNASNSLQKAAANAKDTKESLQDWYAHYQRKRRRNRTLFRIGLLSGLVLALFSAPRAGSDVRQYIAQRWQQYRSYFRK